MAIDAKQQAIETAIAQIEKAYGKGSIMKMGESIGKKFEIAVQKFLVLKHQGKRP